MKTMILIVTVFCGQMLFGQWTGSGTSGDPYQISTVTDLASLASNVDNGTTYSGIYFKQMNDLDLNVAPYNTGTGWNPIGGSYMGEYSRQMFPFTGIYDGNGKTISNLFINQPDSEYVGLFGYGNGSIRDLNLVNVDITGKSEIGGLAGFFGYYNWITGSVYNCSVSGDVAAIGGMAGILIGWNTGTVTVSHTSGTVSGGNNYVGGLVGYNSHGAIIDSSYSSAVITGVDVIGGLVGGHYDNGDGSAITNSYATGAVTSTGNYVGGLVGSTDASVTNSYATGAVSGNDYIGGLVGKLSGTVSNCYSTGNVTATIVGTSGYWGVGGFVGNMSYGGTVNTSCATGSVTSANTAGGFVGQIEYDGAESFVSNSYARGSVSAYYAGGFVGYFGWGQVSKCYATGSVTGTQTGGFAHDADATWGITSNCFWNTTTSGQSNAEYAGAVAGITGKNTAEMQTQSTFTDATWSNSTWYMGDGMNDGYAYLSWENPGGTPLPVEIISLSVTSVGSAAQLKWSTATEVNNYGFEIERKTENSWKMLGFISGGGTSNTPQDYSFTDRRLSPGRYAYRIKQVDHDGAFKYTQTVEVEIGSVANEFSLGQNFPNPFNPATMIRFTVPDKLLEYAVQLQVYDILGQEVVTVFEGKKSPGYYEIPFNGSSFTSGIYFYRILVTGKSNETTFSAVKKMVLMK